MPLKLYQDIHSMPLARYIDCECDNNLFALVITGNPSIEKLQAAWHQIKEQVAEIGGGDNHSLLRSLYKEVCELQLHYHEILTIVDALKLMLTHCINHSYNLPIRIFEKQNEYHALLNKYLQSNFKFNIWDVEAYVRELSGSLTRAGSIKIKLDLRTMAYEQVKSKVEKSGKEIKVSRAYFDKLLINISDYSKYELTEENITVSKFFERVKRYTEYCKTLQASKKR
jgi:hypothetical protein